MPNFQDKIEARELKVARKRAIRAARKAPCVSIVYMNDGDDVEAIHVGTADVINTLRIARAHKETAKNLEAAIMEGAGITKARLAKLYKEIGETTETTWPYDSYSTRPAPKKNR